MKTHWNVFELAERLEVIEQIHSEVVQAEIGDAHPFPQIFEVDDFFLKTLQLKLSVVEVFFLGVEQVVVPGAGKVANEHFVFNP